MKNLIQKYKDLFAAAESTKLEIGEKLLPIIRIFNSNPADSKYIEKEDVLKIRVVEIRDFDFMVCWEEETGYNSGYEVIPFSIFDSEDCIENAKNLIKSKEREDNIKNLERAKRLLKSSIEKIATLEEKLKENV